MKKYKFKKNFFSAGSLFDAVMWQSYTKRRAFPI